MNIRQTTDVEKFAEQALPFLQHRPAEHNLLLALLRSLLSSQSRSPAVLITVEQAQETVAVALQTAARPLLLSRMESPASIEALVYHIQTCWPSQTVPLRQSLRQFGAPQAEGALLAKRLRRKTGLRYEPKIAMRIHRLTQVIPARSRQYPMCQLAAGTLRLARSGDRPQLIRWSRAFELEAFGEPRTDPALWVDRSLHAASLYLWEASTGPVAMVAGQGSIERREGGRIGPVYTPPRYRGRGYATAATAALSQQLLDQGCSACYLFTDLNNPTANRIYQAIGYSPVCNWDEYAVRG